MSKYGVLLGRLRRIARRKYNRWVNVGCFNKMAPAVIIFPLSHVELEMLTSTLWLARDSLTITLVNQEPVEKFALGMQMRIPIMHIWWLSMKLIFGEERFEIFSGLSDVMGTIR